MIQVNKGHCSRDASMKKNEIHPVDNKLLSDVRHIIDTARANAIRSVDFSRVTMYWNLGRRIFEEEQQGKDRADYGARIVLLSSGSDTLTIESFFWEQSRMPIVLFSSDVFS